MSTYAGNEDRAADLLERLSDMRSARPAPSSVDTPTALPATPPSLH